MLPNSESLSNNVDGVHITQPVNVMDTVLLHTKLCPAACVDIPRPKLDRSPYTISEQ